MDVLDRVSDLLALQTSNKSDRLPKRHLLPSFQYSFLSVLFLLSTQIDITFIVVTLDSYLLYNFVLMSNKFKVRFLKLFTMTL